MLNNLPSNSNPRSLSEASSESAISHWAIVLAAGASTRMGRCKAGLPWLNGVPLLAYQTQQLLAAGIQPIVVLGAHNAQQQTCLSPDCQIAINLQPERGKVSSILIGLKHLAASFSSLTIVAVDQPRSCWIYQTLVQAHLQSTAPITVPTYQGRRGHPLVFSPVAWSLLQNLSEDTLGLRQIIHQFDAQIQQVEFDTADVLMDLNTPERYQEALKD